MFVYWCRDCGRTYGRDDVRYLCPVCGERYRPGQPLVGVLEAVFDYATIRKSFDKRKPDWSLFSAVEPKYYPDFPVGNTPFIKTNRLGKELGFTDLWIKNDGLNPSGSLKDRASFLVVAEAIRLGENRIVTASTGNAASALAAVCAAAGLEAVIFVPKSAPKAKLVQIALYGATIILVEGAYDDAFKLSLEYTKKRGGLNRNTAYHPLTIEGKKTVAHEICAQNGFQPPDAVLVPVGDGVIIAAVYKGFWDLMQAGVIHKMPRLICVQAARSDAIHHFITTGKYRNAAKPLTIADSISVSAPSNAHMARRAVLESKGFSMTVSDSEIRSAQALLARTTGVFAEPAAAAAAAGLQKIARQKLLAKSEQIVLLVTGHGLKDIETPLARLKLARPVPPRLDAVKGI
ncbi:MAG: threonine synthase [Candidatus Edwardsbacteria bacterium]|nr:threonine synthase [Candidatus Edwardsbacteria bacterium]